MTDRNIQGLVSVTQLIITDTETRRNFLESPAETLASLGVEIKDEKLLDTLCSRLKVVIEEEIATHISRWTEFRPIAVTEPLTTEPGPIQPINDPYRPIAGPVAAVIDPVGPVADVTVGAAITVGVVTGASTGVATYAATKTAQDVTQQPLEDEWDQVVMDFGRIGLIEKYLEAQGQIAVLGQEVTIQRSRILGIAERSERYRRNQGG